MYFIKEFYDPNYLYRFIFCNLESAYINVTMAGTTLPSINAKPPLHFILNLNERNTWPSLHSNSSMWCCLLSPIALSFLLKVKLKIYFKKKNTNKNSKVKKSKTNVMKTLVLISLCKILLICIIFLLLKTQKLSPKNSGLMKKDFPNKPISSLSNITRTFTKLMMTLQKNC